MVELHNADCLKILGGFEPDSIDACVTDPPYGIRFMGAAWDGKDIEDKIKQRRAIESADPGNERLGRRERAAGPNAGYRSSAAEAGKYDRSNQANQAFQQWTEEWAREMYRVLKPGAWLLSFSSTRTYHRMTTGIEDAGFEIRDQLGWCFFSGFPKSFRVALQFESELCKRVVVAGRQTWVYVDDGKQMAMKSPFRHPFAEKWAAYGTALKPAWEPICLARKPLDGTVAENVAKWGTGCVNIDGCRVALADDDELNEGIEGDDKKLDTEAVGWGFSRVDREPGLGRFPSNIIIDGSPEVVSMFPSDAGAVAPVKGTEPSARTGNGIYGQMDRGEGIFHADSGSASRFFFVAKASRSDRDAGCEMLKAAPRDVSRKEGNPGGDNPRNRGLDPRQNTHPTVKPTELMRYLCRLVTPPGGTVIDPFMGSGSTGRGAILEGFNFVGIEKEEAYMPIARARIREAEGELFSNIK